MALAYGEQRKFDRFSEYFTEDTPTSANTVMP